MLEAVTARLRPRNPWEGLDLGLAMARRSYARLMLQSLAVLLPFWGVLAALLWRHPGWFLFLTWWLKPAYARLPLFTLSRILFGQKTSHREFFRAVPGLLFRDNLHFLTWGRFSFWRCFTMPALVLEKSSYGSYRRRAAVLMRHGGSQAMSFGIAWMAATLGLIIGGFKLAGWLVPRFLSEDLSEVMRITVTSSTYEAEPAVYWTLNVLHLAAMLLLEIFYVGAGFGLYLNSRTHLEGWDIEITFRSLAERLSSTAAVAVLAAWAMFAGNSLAAAPKWQSAPPPSVSVESDGADPAIEEAHGKAAPETAAARELIGKIKAHPDFKVHTEEIKVRAAQSAPKSDVRLPDLSFMQYLGSALFYLILALLAAGLGWLIYKNRHLFLPSKEGKGSGREEKEGPRTVLGLDIRPETLPANIQQAAMQRWLTGDAHGALRLLYAGSLSWMVERAGLPIRESDTEGDCLRHASALPDLPRTDYFQELTDQWIHSAYARQAPPGPTMERLLHGWPFGRRVSTP
ncbi:MAG: DUF4129 domain-containing protein [Verrucomicrobiales bacterium]|nr:DUF4129 domain-containing protein [Verrucomicrobiales bacterium]